MTTLINNNSVYQCRDVCVMRLLRVSVQGVALFKDLRFDMDLYASDRVVRLEGSDYPEDVTKVDTHNAIYSQNVIGISGVNASGKTTVLNLLTFVFRVMLNPFAFRHAAFVSNGSLINFADTVRVEAVFYQDGHYYLLESDITAGSKDLSLLIGASPSSNLVFNDEWLWQYDALRIKRSTIASVENFKKSSRLLVHRNAAYGEPGFLTDEEKTYLNDDVSVVSSVLRNAALSGLGMLDRSLPTETLPIEIVQAFDPSVERMVWDEESQVYELRFKGYKSRFVSREVAENLLSSGTIVGTGMVMRAIEQLASGGYLIIDEIEAGLNRSLVGTIIQLFASPVTNPRGAQLIFSTHYPELLDDLHRKDSVYLLVRDEEYRTVLVKYSDRVSRIENKKSEVVLSNMVRGTMPRYPDVQTMRNYVKECVSG